LNNLLRDFILEDVYNQTYYNPFEVDPIINLRKEALLNLTSVSISNQEDLEILVEIYNAWKKEIAEGSIPVGPGGITTSILEIYPTLAGA
jgi:hypothetical protein